MRVRLLLLATVAAPLAFGSAAITVSPASAQAVTMKDIREARKDATRRVRQAEKAVKQAERGLRQAQKKNEGIEEAQAELDAANQELQAAQQQLKAAMSAEPSGAGESQQAEETTAPVEQKAAEEQQAVEETPADTADVPQRKRKRQAEQPEQTMEKQEAAESQPEQPAESSAETSRAAEQQRLDDEERRKRRAERRQRRLELEAKADTKEEVEVEIKASEAVGTELDDRESRQVERLRRKLREQRQQIQALEEAQTEPDEQVVRRTQDGRIIVRQGQDGQLVIRSRDDNERFLRRARDVEVEDLPRGRTRTTITRPNGSQIVTVRDRRGDINYRLRRNTNGREIVLIDNRNHRREPGVRFEVELPRLIVPIPRNEYIVDLERADRRLLRDTLLAPPVETVERVYTLDEIRQSERLRDKMRRVDLDTVTFDTGSARISPSQVNALAEIGYAMEDALVEDPDAVFLIEGHTDAVGSDGYNLALSDDRAESVAIVLSENFEIPPENLVTQGYGEEFLKIDTLGPERRNRRVTVRPITDLIRPQSS